MNLIEILNNTRQDLYLDSRMTTAIDRVLSSESIKTVQDYLASLGNHEFAYLGSGEHTMAFGSENAVFRLEFFEHRKPEGWQPAVSEHTANVLQIGNLNGSLYSVVNRLEIIAWPPLGELLGLMFSLYDEGYLYIDSREGNFGRDPHSHALKIADIDHVLRIDQTSSKHIPLAPPVERLSKTVGRTLSNFGPRFYEEPKFYNHGDDSFVVLSEFSTPQSRQKMEALKEKLLKDGVSPDAILSLDIPVMRIRQRSIEHGMPPKISSIEDYALECLAEKELSFAGATRLAAASNPGRSN